MQRFPIVFVVLGLVGKLCSLPHGVINVADRSGFSREQLLLLGQRDVDGVHDFLHTGEALGRIFCGRALDQLLGSRPNVGDETTERGRGLHDLDVG